MNAAVPAGGDARDLPTPARHPRSGLRKLFHKAAHASEIFVIAIEICFGKMLRMCRRSSAADMAAQAEGAFEETLPDLGGNT